MKKIFLLVFSCMSITLFGQNFEKQWLKVTTLEADGKIKSANDAVSKIFRKANRRNDEPELVKAFLFQSKYSLVLEEESQRNFFRNLDKTIPETSKSTQAILHFIYAKSLSDYYKRNSYYIDQRTATDSVFDNDFKTWPKKTYNEQINHHFELSLEPEELLLETPLKNYQALVIKGKTLNNDNRSLYDFLAEESIRYYTTAENFYRDNKINVSDNKELINQLTGSTSEFLAADLSTLSEIAQKILGIYKKTEKNYLNNNNFFWLENTALERLNCIFEHFSNDDDNDFQDFEIASFEKNSLSFKDPYFINESKLILAERYINQASKEKNKDYLKKALLLSEDVQKSSVIEHAHKAKKIGHRIITKSITVNYEPTLIPNRINRVLINYRNVDKIYGFVYKNDSDLSNLEYKNDEQKDSLLVDILKTKTPVKTFEQNLPKHDDFFNYSTETLYPELEKGSYWIVFRSDNTPLTYDSPVGYAMVKATNLVIQSFIDKDSQHHIQLLNRTSGKPVENADVVLPEFKLKTDKNGKAVYQLNENRYETYKNFYCVYEKDTLHYINFYQYKPQPKEIKARTFAKITILTDRSIYRPGQKVFFKAIASYLDNEEKASVITDKKLDFIVRNSNQEKIYEISLTTNEFGSVSGEFTLPKTGLTGHHEIEVINNPFPTTNVYDYYLQKSVSFNVEEYKRPKFEIAFDPINSSYAVNQKITVKGNAKALAGSNITEAKVVYRIVRNTHNSRYYYYNYIQDNTQISQGETTTDANGKFSIDFTAIPNPKSDKKNLPIFSYTVHTDITDSSGETRSSQTNVNVGYHTLKIGAEISSVIKPNEKPTILLSSLNLNDNFSPTLGELKIYKLQAPDRVLTARKTIKPEIQTISKEEFIRLFPFEPYEDEDNKNTWKKGAVTFSASINTAKSKKITLFDLKNWKSGEYELIFTAKDTIGNDVETKQKFRLVNDKDTWLADNQLFHHEVINKNPKTDGFILLKLMTAAPALYINTEAYNENRIFFSNSTPLEKGTAFVKIPLEKTFKKEVRLEMDFILDNTRNVFSTMVALPEAVEKLDFETMVLRNKIEPSSNETWSFSVKNEAKKGALAEVLASMYDASLDEFSKAYWNTILINKTYPYYYSHSKVSSNFYNNNFGFRNLNPPVFFITTGKTTDRFNWYGFNINDYRYRLQGISSGIVLKDKISPKPKKGSKFKASGVVSEGGLPLPGVSVMIKGTTIGTQTDMDGKYSLNVTFNDILMYSFIGMKDATTIVSEYATVNVNMDPESTTLENVVVTAVGIKKRSDDNSLDDDSLKDSDELYQAANPNVVQSLKGQVAGLQITSGNGVNANTRIVLRGNRSISDNNDALVVIDGIISDSAILQGLNPDMILSTEILKGAEGAALYGEAGVNGVIVVTTKKSLDELTKVKARKNLDETAFFFPHLKTDKNGKISFSFTSPEALTRWRLRMLAHNKKAVTGYYENTITTQKDLMVTPNFPRFFREKDTVYVTAKVANMTYEAKTGIAVLQLFDAVTMEPIDAKVMNTESVKKFNITAKGNTVVTWKIVISEGLQGIQYKVLAKAGNFSDGEENILPVVTNAMLVTESIPIWVREGNTKKYAFENMKNNTSSTLRNHILTLEYTSNPTWLAIQSLPYLLEYEHECAEQTFARLYGNALATTIINSNPKLATVFENWKKDGKLNSKLDQNEELKSVILAETPWLLDAKSDEEKKKSLALLLDLNKMKTSLTETFQKLKAKQNGSGGFGWFNGMEESSYITNHIMAGLGHLEKLKINPEISDKFEEISETAVPFMDAKFMEYHKKRTEKLKDSSKLIWQQPYSELHYLYARSFYLEAYPLSAPVKKTTDIYLEQCRKNWLTYSLYEKGMAALALHRYGDTKIAKDILTHFKETASNNEDWGMYWIDNKAGWYWYQAPIETQALLIEAFAEINKDTQSVDAMKVWLLKSRQSTNWPSTKATTEAVYALLLQGTGWLSVKDNTVIKVGNEKIATKKLLETEKEAETGYIKMSWKADEIKKEMAELSVENKSKVPGYGGYFWQYFEDLDKIKTYNGGVMTVSKELYLNKNNDNGKQLQRITQNNPLKIGDLVTVRLIVKTTEDMEYVHLKDMRAAGFEPVDVISTHHWKDGLSYYQSTKDLATHFFFDTITKGTYVLEYDVRVNNKGDFSNGITTIQSMYAPEFTSHSKGIRVRINE